MKIITSRYAQIGLALILAVLLIASFSTSASAGGPGPVYHTVQPGQTLYSIAMNYGTSVWAISCANGLFNPNYIYAGQVLVIPFGPMGDGCAPAHKPMPQPIEWHPQPQPMPLGCFYTVRWGDNLFRVALRYNVPWTVLAQANGLFNGNYIYAGQVLRVPCVW